MDFLKVVWRPLRWLLLTVLSLLLLLILSLLVDTPTWKVFELLIIPAALGLGVWWLDKQEAQRQKTEQDQRERDEIEVEYKLGLATLKADYPLRIRDAVGRNDAVQLLKLQTEYKAKQAWLEERRTTRLAQLDRKGASDKGGKGATDTQPRPD